MAMRGKVARNFLVPVVLAAQAVVSAISPGSVSALSGSHLNALNSFRSPSSVPTLGKRVSLWASNVLKEANGHFMGHRSHSSHSSHSSHVSHASHVSHYSGSGSGGSGGGGGSGVIVTPSFCIDAGQLSNAEVALIQQTLKIYGYSPGSTDGVWGQKTFGALKKYEQSNFLPLSIYSSVNTATLQRLGIVC